MQDLTIKGYYDSLDRKDYISTDLMVKVGLEWFLSTLLFKGDVNRVLYSKEDIVFRRRTETVGKGFVKGDNNINYVSLDLPFACYSAAGSFEEDDRTASMNTAAAVKGWVSPETGIVVKAMPVKINYQATAFFAKLRDVDKAATLLYWEQYPKAPLYMSVENDVAGMKVDVPVNVTIESIDQSPEYAEKEWLNKSKIFPVKIGLTIRTYQILIEDFENTIKLPVRFSGLYAYNDEDIVFTQKTSLIWANEKWTPHIKSELNLKKLDAKDLLPDMRHTLQLDGSEDKEAIYTDNQGKEVIINNNGKTVKEKIDDVIADTVEGYFNQDRDCNLDELKQSAQTEDSVTISWVVRESEITNFKSLTFYIPGICSQGVYDCNANEIVIKGLNPGSTYECTVIAYSNNDTKITYNLKLKTDGKAIIPEGGSGKLSDKLIGFTFQR